MYIQYMAIPSLGIHQEKKKWIDNEKSKYYVAATTNMGSIECCQNLINKFKVHKKKTQPRSLRRHLPECYLADQLNSLKTLVPFILFRVHSGYVGQIHLHLPNHSVNKTSQSCWNILQSWAQMFIYVFWFLFTSKQSFKHFHSLFAFMQNGRIPFPSIHCCLPSDMEILCQIRAS